MRDHLSLSGCQFILCTVDQKKWVPERKARLTVVHVHVTYPVVAYGISCTCRELPICAASYCRAFCGGFTFLDRTSRPWTLDRTPSSLDLDPLTLPSNDPHPTIVMPSMHGFDSWLYHLSSNLCRNICHQSRTKSVSPSIIGCRRQNRPREHFLFVSRGETIGCKRRR